MKVLSLVFAAAWTLPLVAQAINLRPGNYEQMVEIELPNGMKMPMKNTSCITAADLKDGVKSFIDEMGDSCKVSDLKASANKLSFTAACKEADSAMTMSGEMTFSGDSYAGTFNAKDEKGQPFNFKMSGKRIGECK